MQRALLLLLVVASYLLLAGARPWTLGPLVLLATLATLSGLGGPEHFPKEHRRFDLALLAIVIGVGVQLVPLPTAIVDVLSPNAARIRESLQFATTAPSNWTSLSINPQRTRDALAAVIVGVLSFWSARAVFSTSGSTRSFCRALAIVGALVAVAAMIQKASTPRLMLFTVVPEVRTSNPFGAFNNRNHFAGWLLLISAPTAGYLVARLRMHSSRDHRWRSALTRFMASGAVMTALSLVVTIGTLLLTLSRSALVGLGVAAVVAWRFLRPRLKFERSTMPTQLAVVGIVLVFSMMFIDLDGWATRFDETRTAEGFSGRTVIWKETVPIVRDFWLTGTGAGTYSSAMTSYQQTRLWVEAMQRWAHFNNAHSHYLQVAAEGGVLLSLPVLVALGTLWTLTRQTLRADKGEMFWVRVGAAAGLAALAAQSIWEVSLTMPANAVLAGILVGLLLYRREASVPDPVAAPPEPPTPAPVPLRMAR